jgi:hypothetical protein
VTSTEPARTDESGARVAVYESGSDVGLRSTVVEVVHWFRGRSWVGEDGRVSLSSRYDLPRAGVILILVKCLMESERDN